MFNTNDFLGAELAYRQEQLKADLDGVRHHSAPRRRSWLHRDDRQG